MFSKKKDTLSSTEVKECTLAITIISCAMLAFSLIVSFIGFTILEYKLNGLTALITANKHTHSV